MFKIAQRLRRRAGVIASRGTDRMQALRLAVESAPSKYALPQRYVDQRVATSIDEPACSLHYQPDVYRFAGHLLTTAELERVYDIGCGAVRVLRSVVPEDTIVGVDIGQNLQTARAELPAAAFIEHDLDKNQLHIRPEDLEKAVVVCSDVVEHLVRPHLLLESLAIAARTAPFMLISTPDRTRCRGIGDLGPPANSAHVREWTADEFYHVLSAHDLEPQLMGHTVNTRSHLWKSTLLSVHGKHARYTPSPQRSCLAIISTYNDHDFLPTLVQHLLSQGVHMHFVDNWSDDGTFEWLLDAKRRHEDKIVAVERFPTKGSTKTYKWEAILNRKAEIAAASRFDWAMHYDSDELRESPWRNVSLADAISFVDACGYDCIDHVVLDFRATEDGFTANCDARNFFNFCEFGRRSGHFVQVKCWKNNGAKVDLTDSGGHYARFDRQEVYPLKFLLKHYPLRSLDQMRRKIFAERQDRLDPKERIRGWHGQYGSYVDSDKPLNLWDPLNLSPYNPMQFPHEYLVERLTSLGLNGEH